MSYDDWKTDPDYGKSRREIEREELEAEAEEECQECGHKNNLHDPKYGCEYDLGDVEGDESGPAYCKGECGCKAYAYKEPPPYCSCCKCAPCRCDEIYDQWRDEQDEMRMEK